MQLVNLAPPVSDLPIALLNSPQNIGMLVVNTLFKLFLGPRTFGRTLNVGAGESSVIYNQRSYFAAQEYHTLESADSQIEATYRCSATDMAQIPDESYDWVISTAVLEHVDDCWAAAREQVRVTKPGGFIYCMTPFDQILHPASYFGDYWRFTPQGLRTLFKGMHAIETEAWGDDPTKPSGFAVLFQKPGPNVAPPAPVHHWFEYRDNEEPFGLFVIGDDFRRNWTIHELLIDPMNLAMQINPIWNQLGAQHGVIVPHIAMTRAYQKQFSRVAGSVSIRGTGVRFIPE